MSETRAPSPCAPYWFPSEPEAERQARLAAWQAYRSCADCRFWGEDDVPDDEPYRVCNSPHNYVAAGVVVTPEDYACEFFDPPLLESDASA